MDDNQTVNTSQIIGYPEESNKVEGKEAGASGWLIKPFKPDQLIGVVSRFVK